MTGLLILRGRVKKGTNTDRVQDDIKINAEILKLRKTQRLATNQQQF